jgi:hypothetical protein
MKVAPMRRHELNATFLNLISVQHGNFQCDEYNTIAAGRAIIGAKKPQTVANISTPSEGPT